MQHRYKKDVMADHLRLLVFYRKTRPTDKGVEQVYPIMIDSMKKAGITPTVVAVKRSGNKEKVKEIKPTTLRRRIEKEKQTGFELISFHDIGKMEYVERCYLYDKSIVNVWRSAKSEFFEILVQLPLLDIELNSAVEIFKKLHKVRPFSYGLMETFPRTFYPDGFVHGIGSGRTSAEEMNFRSNWDHDTRNNQSFANKRLRDVFPVNFINKGHLDQNIKSVFKTSTLQGWIERSKTGSLEKIVENNWLWVIEEEQDRLRARQVLRQNNLLIHYCQN